MDHKRKLLALVRQNIRLKHDSLRTERAYIAWIKRAIFFHHKRHPASMGAPEIRAFLSHLAVARKVAASTQSQALRAYPKSDEHGILGTLHSLKGGTPDA